MLSANAWNYEDLLEIAKLIISTLVLPREIGKKHSFSEQIIIDFMHGQTTLENEIYRSHPECIAQKLEVQHNAFLPLQLY